MTTTHRLRNTLLGIGAAAAVALTSAAAPAFAAPRTPAPTGYTVRTFAAVGSETNPDDITRLGDSIYVAFQNGVHSMGQPAASGATSSTIQQYSLTGRPGASWNITGKIDGLGSDQSGHRLLVTTNEDGNSSFHTVTPGAGSNAVKDYAYTGLTHGGGTDSALVYHGMILISASAPTVADGPAVYRATLSGSTAALTPLFSDQATATAVNGASAGSSVQLALTDPDSSEVVPSSIPGYRGDFMLDSQGDQQLIFTSHAGTPTQSLRVLNLAQPVNDTVFLTPHATTLWTTDPTHNSVDAITGPFQSGEVLTAVTPDAGSNYLATVDLATGALTPIPQLASVHPSGLLLTNAKGSDAKGRQDQQGDSNDQGSNNQG